MFSLIKINLMQKLRNNNFLMLIFVSIFIGYLCVPSESSGYSIFYLGGVRGIYNSAWLGSLAVLLSAIILWLPGFLLLRNEISLDKKMKLNEIIAYSPISKSSYIISKCMSNFIILFILNSAFLFSFVIMQLLRGESDSIQLGKYLAPFILITLPSIFILSSLTILFDVLKILRKTIGNILIFMLWIGITTTSIIIPGNVLDLFCIGKILDEMLLGAKTTFPNINTETGSFGYYQIDSAIPTFVWDGLTFDSSFIVSRLIFLLLFSLILILCIIAFDRFKEKQVKAINKDEGEIKKKLIITANKKLSSVTCKITPSIFYLIKIECKKVFLTISFKKRILYLAGIILSWTIPLSGNVKLLPFLMFILLPILSGTSTCDKKYGTRELFMPFNGFSYKCISIFSTNIIISLFFSLGIIVRFYTIGKNDMGLYWLIGTIFTAVLSLFLGIVTENEHYFEGIYIAILYLGPINGIEIFDFLFKLNNYFYLILSIILSIISSIIYKRKSSRRI